MSPAQLRYIKPSAVEVAGQALATAPSSGADAHVRSGAPLEGEDGANSESVGEEGDEEEVDLPDHAGGSHQTTMDANLSAQVLENVALVSIIVKHLQLWGLRMAYINLAFAKEARCCRAEYLTVFACVEALVRTLEGTELQEGVLENKPYLRLSAEEDDKLFWPEARRCRDAFGHELLRLIVFPHFPRMKKEYL